MHWTDEAVILSTHAFGENKVIVHAFARERGVHHGVIRGIASRSNRGVIQVGNFLSLTWNARLPEQLGAFRGELLRPYAAWCMLDKYKLTALLSVCSLLSSALPERHPYPILYRQLIEFLDRLVDSQEWHEDYVRFELSILAESGFGLELDRCAATGQTDDLLYVSPKSGRAVSKDAGEPYKERLSKLVKAINLSKITMRGIKQNLFWAFIYNIIGIPLAGGLFFPIFGWLLSPVFAGFAMAMSSVSVVGNSLRLKTKKL